MCLGTPHAKFYNTGWFMKPPFLELPKIWPFMAKTLYSHGPKNCFFLNLNQCDQGCSMPNFTLLDLSCSPHSYNWPKYGPSWPKYGPHMVLQIGSSWILIIVPRDVPCQSSHCWVYPVALFPSNWFFLNLNHCVQGCYTPNFTLLGLSYSPPS